MGNVCKNYEIKDIDKNNLGFAHSDNQLPYVFLPLISIILNFIVINTYVSHKHLLKGQ